MNVISDTSFLFALISEKEKLHQECVAVAKQINGQITIPVTVLPELAYLLLTRRGHHVMRAFIRELQLPIWKIASLEVDDLIRVSELLEQYHDAELDFADATIVAIAERLNVVTVLTLDQRDFRMIRPSHVDHFTILPQINRTE